MTFSIIHKLPSQSSEVKLLQVCTALYLRDVELIVVGLMGAFHESLIFFLALGYMKKFGIEWSEDVLVQIL